MCNFFNWNFKLNFAWMPWENWILENIILLREKITTFDLVTRNTLKKIEMYNALIYMKKNINVNKTEFILLSHLKQESRDKYKITLTSVEIPWSNHYKYLGIILDQKSLTFQQHMTIIRNEFWAARYKLFPLITRNSNLCAKNKMLVYI